MGLGKQDAGAFQPRRCPADAGPHCRALVAALSSPEQQVKVMRTGTDCMVQMRHVQPMVLILCEAFINAMKYAHPARAPLT